MHKNKFAGFLCLIFLFSMSCIDEFRPDIDRYENLLVVDGMITNAEPPYTVKLSLSTTVQNPVYTPLTKAKVTISDNQGNSERLEEITDGIYQTSKEGIQGVCGHAYRIEIETIKGKMYQSDYETLRKPVKIDTVYGEMETREEFDTEETLEGMQFYVDAQISEQDTVHLLWRCAETYRFKTDYRIDFIYDNNGFRKFHDPDSVRYCFKTNQIDEIACMRNTTNKTKPALRMPLNYVSTNTKRLTIRYSLLVRQLTVNEATYFYWNHINKQNEELSSFYSKQPYQVRSNVKNTDDAKEPVLGYFNVAGEHQQRIFVNRPSNMRFHYFRCEIETDYSLYLAFSNPSMWPIYLADTPQGRGIADKRCFDCTLWGGVVEEPDFWVGEWD